MYIVHSYPVFPLHFVVPLATKRPVIDKLMEIQRIQGVEIVEKEMLRFLEYYTKKCIMGLYSKHARLEELLRGNDVLQYMYCIATERIPLIFVV